MVAFFICPYKRRFSPGLPKRYCAMDDFTAEINAEGGKWVETEILGNRAIVKVRASAALLSTIEASPGIRRFPLNRLDDTLSSLPAPQRNQIRDEITDAGYSSTELRAAIPNLGAATLRDVLQFMAGRRLKPRYDKSTDTIILDGPIQLPKSIEEVNRVVN